METLIKLAFVFWITLSIVIATSTKVSKFTIYSFIIVSLFSVIGLTVTGSLITLGIITAQLISIVVSKITYDKQLKTAYVSLYIVLGYFYVALAMQNNLFI